MGQDDTPARVRWARLRFSIIGSLLAEPAELGQLSERLAELAGRVWRHPTTGEAVRFSVKTIERWYYAARREDDPLRALERKVPSHAGTHPTISPALAAALALQHDQHPRCNRPTEASLTAALTPATVPVESEEVCDGDASGVDGAGAAVRAEWPGPGGVRAA